MNPTLANHAASSEQSDSSRSNSPKSGATHPPSTSITTSDNDSPKKGHPARTKQEHPSISTLQTAILTTLSNAPPGTLTSFIDPATHTFKALFKTTRQLVIWRKGNAVFIGIFNHHASLKAFGFEHLIGLLIAYDGSWRLVAGAGNAFCAPRWSEVWTGKYECFGGLNKMVVDGEGMEGEKGVRAGMLAVGILEGRFWEGGVDVRVT